ncbi:G protein-activated inward rectifier potassium channel 3-like isoform X2 [Bacillus rossius redtenbacheri]|uniref:G protein-activated inward rectifier potassium channel 3-like isoform X2 n=1 Tax=Bacillus rossius redtenbacheri TaxID=93214 RepID=UPI002FDE2717
MALSSKAAEAEAGNEDDAAAAVESSSSPTAEEARAMLQPAYDSCAETASLRSPMASLVGSGEEGAPCQHHRGFLRSASHNQSVMRPLLTYSPSFAPSVATSKGTRSRYRNGVRKLRKRAVLKNGECNVLLNHIHHRKLRFLQDIFTTLVDVQWRWTLLVFALSFILSWLGFALIWWLIAFTHGDLEDGHLPHQQEDSGWMPCVFNIFSFASCFLFSVETQHTIGYGSRSTTEECPEAIFVMCLQSITGVMIQAFMVGIVFAKMSRPKQRTQTLLFSRVAVICQRDGDLCLMFRVGDMRKSHIIGATVRAQMIRTRTTKEGEVLPQAQAELRVGTDGGDENLFFIWPTTVVHRIDKDSPLYTVSANHIIGKEARFEIVVILEGTIESTGQTTQARSSYLPSEILWGHRFEPVVEYNKERQGYEVNYSKFNDTQLVDTPLCSARDLEEFYRVQDDCRHPADAQTYDAHLCLRRVTSAPNKMDAVVEDPSLLSL